jgi:hypothetical protein
MPGQLVQSTFQFGEISPLMLARADSQIYYRALRKARNVLVIPQGGVTVRFGTEYIDDLSNHTTDYTELKPFIFDYEDGARYVLLFRENAIDVYYNDSVVATLTTTYAASEISSLSIAQSQNLVFVAHGSHAPAIIRRTSAHAGWSIDTSPRVVAYPTYDFRDDYESLTFQIQISATPITTAQNLLGQVVDIVSGSGTPFSADHVGGLFFAEGGTFRS